MIHAAKTGGYLYMSFKYGTFEGYRGDKYFTDFTEENFAVFIKQFPEMAWNALLWLWRHLATFRRMHLGPRSKTPLRSIIWRCKLPRYNLRIWFLIEHCRDSLMTKMLPWIGRKTKTIELIEMTNRERVLLPYTLGTSSNLKKEIHFQKPWITMIQDNAVAILGWIQYEKVKREMSLLISLWSRENMM